VVDEAELLKEHTGTGRITSSGTTVHGTGTEFMTQLSPGDAIIITHPTSYADNFVAVFCFMSLTRLCDASQVATGNQSCADGTVERQHGSQFQLLDGPN
jgi:hypothetical protein